MYWLRTPGIIDPLLFVISSILWMTGGWLLVSHSGRFLKRERPIAGIASGMLLYILLGNAFAHWFPAYLAFASAAILIFVIGLWASRTIEDSLVRINQIGNSAYKHWHCFSSLVSLS